MNNTINNTINNLKNRITDLKESYNNNLHITNVDKTEKNDIILYTAIQMLSSAIANGGKLSVPNVNVIPSKEMLMIKTYVNDVALFNTFLIQLAYKLDIDSAYNSSNDFAIPKNYLLQFLPPGSVIVKILVYNCNNIFSKTNTYGGFILEFNGSSFIVLRGTLYKSEWYENGKIALETPYWLQNAKVHTGFNNMYINPKNQVVVKSLRNQIIDYLNSKYIEKIFVTGHSLGGGIAYLLEGDISFNIPNLRQKINFYIVAGPYSGNQSFVNLIMNVNKIGNYTGTFSLINTRDVVPTTAVVNYERVSSQLFCFTNPSISIADSHSIDNYRNELQNYDNIISFINNVNAGKASCGPLTCPPDNSKEEFEYVQKESFEFIIKKKYNLTIYIIIGIFITAIIIFLYLFFKKTKNKKLKRY